MTLSKKKNPPKRTKRNNPTLLCIVADIDAKKLGGAEMHFVEVAKRISSKYNLIIVTGPKTNIKSILPYATCIPINYPHIPNLFGILFNIWGSLILTSKLKAIDFDCIWAKQTFPQTPLATILKHVYKKPVYVTIQNPQLHTEEYVIKGPLKLVKSLLTTLIDPIIRYSLSQADRASAVSSYSKSQAQKMGAKNVNIIPNGVDLKIFAKQAVAPRKKIKILTTSSLIPRNGIDTLIKACALLPKKTIWQLSIAGDGPELSKLKSLTAHYNLEDEITFLGRVENTQIPALLSSHHIFARPSRKEGFGVSFIEAMASGLPVVATPAGGIVDFVTHTETGMLAEVDNPQSVADCIQTLASNKKVYSQIKANAKRLVEDRYSWDTIARSVTTEISTLINDE